MEFWFINLWWYILETYVLWKMEKAFSYKSPQWVNINNHRWTLHSSARAARIKHPATKRLKQQKCIIPQFWRPELQCQCVSKASSYEGCDRESVPFPSPSSWWFVGGLWYSLAYRNVTLISTFIFTWHSSCVCICVCICPNIPSL